MSAINRPTSDSVTRTRLIAEHNWVNGGFLDMGWPHIVKVGQESLQAQIIESLSIARSNANVDQVSSFLSGTPIPPPGHSAQSLKCDPLSYDNLRLSLRSWCNLKNSPKTFYTTNLLDVDKLFFNFDPHNLPLEVSFVKSVVKDQLFSQRTTLPHYCVGAVNNWVGDVKAFLYSALSLTFYMGPYMGLSIGHLDYILFSIVAIFLMRKEGINAKLVLIGSFQDTPLWPVISLLVHNDYINLRSISEMTPADYFGYLLRGDTSAFFHFSKFLEQRGIGSTMGFGKRLTLNELKGLQPLEEISRYSRNMSSKQHRIGLHSRTSFYKRDAHMQFRNSSPIETLSALAESGLTKCISLIGVYSPEELAGLEGVAIKHNISLDNPTHRGLSDVLYACGCDEFVGTSSGPAHFSSYFGRTIFLNSTTFHVTNLAVATTVVSFRTVTLTVLGTMHLTKKSFLDLLVSDSLSMHSKYFQVSPLTEKELYAEICLWQNNKTAPLSSISEFASLGLVYADVHITTRTKTMFENLLSRLNP